MSLELMNDAYQSLLGFEPNPMQTAVWEHIDDSGEDWGIGLLLKGLTGSGKTEAIAVPALAKGKRLIMVYPTRSLVDDQIGRFQKLLQKLSKFPKHKDKRLTLTVDTGTQSRRYCWRNGCPVDTPGGERPTRHFHYGDVIITTLDKFLYRFFGFGEPRKSYIYPLRIRYMNPLICFDEAHAYDEIAFINFEQLVRTLYEKGKDVALMTATMPSAYTERFDYLDPLDFTEGANAEAMAAWKNAPYPSKQLQLIPASIERDEAAPEVPAPAIEAMLAAARQCYEANKRLIVTAETVKDAAVIFKALRDEYKYVYFYHGRLTQEQRKAVYAALIAHEAANEGYLLVSTSAIEVGCDLNAHVLITQLCDPDRLIQRAGRCNRKQKMPDAMLVIVGNSIPQWLTALDDKFDDYYAALQAQAERPFNPTVLTPFLQKKLTHDPRITMMFDMLYEYVYEARLENKQLHENGLIVTRSWEPSLTLCRGENEKGLIDPITVSMPSCRVPQGKEPLPLLLGSDGGIFKRVYDKDTTQPSWEGLGSRWENGYTNDIMVSLPNYDYADGATYDKTLGYIDLPFLFNGPFPRGAKMLLERGADKDKIGIWYIDPQNITAVLTPAEETPDEDE